MAGTAEITGTHAIFRVKLVPTSNLESVSCH